MVRIEASVFGAAKYGGLKDRGEDPVDDADRAGCEVAGEPLDEALDVAGEH
jgi:hypothetical protein